MNYIFNLDNNFYQNNDFLDFAFYIFVAMYYFLTVNFRKKIFIS